MLKGYGLLILSILLEVFSTQMMKLSSGFTKLMPSIAFAVGMAACFYVFSKTLTMLPLGVAYAIWAGLGTVLTVIAAVFVWHEVMTFKMIFGITLIVVGVVLLEL